jgi:hypothetical protein
MRFEPRLALLNRDSVPIGSMGFEPSVPPPPHFTSFALVKLEG